MHKRILKVIIILIMLILYYFLTVYTSFGIPCPYYTFFKIKCPGCGISRMLIHMSQLEFKEAFYDNCVIFVFQPFLYYILIKDVLYYIKGKSLKTNKIENIIIIIFIISLIIFGIIRNFI